MHHQATVEHVATHGEAGAILVFLPGAVEIDRLCASLTASRPLRAAAVAVWAVPLHGSLTAREQQTAFEPPPRGVRKVC